MALAAGLRAALGVLLPAVVVLAAASQVAPVTIELVEEAGRTVVEVRGLEPELTAELARLGPRDPAWAERLAVHTEEASLADGDLPPLLGSYSVISDGVRFTPRFDLAAGVTYVARWRDPNGAGEIRLSFTVPRPELPPSTRVIGIYPSAAEVPANLLRVYLQFSAPMSRGHARRHIRLLDASGGPVVAPFVAPERELWSPDGTRLTLFFDPGRIKRGVGPNAEVGPPLSAGERYRLEVDRRLADARGVPLVADHSRELVVREPDREQPRIEEWRLEPPAGPDDVVRLGFPEPLDRALLEGLLEVLDAAGEPVPGSVTVGHGETAWSFRPDLGWGEGVYRIRVSTLLEDLAGNSLRRRFETALDGGEDEHDVPAWVDLPFSIR